MNLQQVNSNGQIKQSTFANATQASHGAARQIADLIQLRQSEDRVCVLGLATGSSPIEVYAELIRIHRDEGLSFKNVVTFNLDEYLPMAPDHSQSYVRFMNEQLFDHVDVVRENVHVPDGTIAEDQVAEYCKDYERRIADAGGIDIQLLGIGRTGHIGFNEPGSGKGSRTRSVILNEVTRADAAPAFSGVENVPVQAITMGVGTILESRRILLLAFGKHKAEIVRRTIEGEITDSVPASYLQHHGNVEFLLDEEATTNAA